jgi:RES domain-containing protein
MIVYRLTQSVFARDLSGRGAELSGGRWNSPGTALLYTAENRALCVLEMAVHLPLGLMEKSYRMISLRIPDDGIASFPAEEWPEGWDSLPPGQAARKAGDRFVQAQQHLALRVPSAVVKGDFNVLINPRHPQMNRVEIIAEEAFRFDPRLIKGA